MRPISRAQIGLGTKKVSNRRITVFSGTEFAARVVAGNFGEVVNRRRHVSEREAQQTEAPRPDPCSQPMGAIEGDLPFRVELWDAAGARVEQTLAALTDLRLGKAAFAEAVRLCPELRITLRHKTRVIEEHQK